MTIKITIKKCGNPECCSSTNIADETSHGSGYLDESGFWQFPCFICARHYESKVNEDWPHIDQVIPPMPIHPCVKCKKDVVSDRQLPGNQYCIDCYEQMILEWWDD